MRTGVTLRGLGLLGTRVGLTVAVLLAGIGIGAGAASVIASHDTTTIHACVVAGSGTVRIVADATACRKNESATQWNVQGPQGAIGPQGPQGETGSDAVLSDELLHSIKCAAHPQPNIDWQDCSLIFLNLSNTFLSRANLSNANLADANLTGANLSNANLADADLSRANLIDAFLFNADLTGASLFLANLRDANLTNANLTGASLEGNNLTNVTWDNTVCVDGTNSEEHGGTCIGHLD